MRHLVLIHGRAQEHKDPDDLKAAWLDALASGASNAHLSPAGPIAARFPYYGQALFDLVHNVDTSLVADIDVRSVGDDDADAQRLAMLREAAAALGVTDAQIFEAARALPPLEPSSVEGQRAFHNAALIRGLVAALDKHVAPLRGLCIALATRDVSQYLRVPGIRDRIEKGVREAMTPGEEHVVVAHSLGSVVAYNLLRREGAEQGWRVPLFITVGSPLGMRAVIDAVKPDRRLACVDAWYNARDPEDIVALRPLGAEYFTALENSSHVKNDTPNQHGIRGYLADPEIAKRIHAALDTTPVAI